MSRTSSLWMAACGWALAACSGNENPPEGEDTAPATETEGSSDTEPTPQTDTEPTPNTDTNPTPETDTDADTDPTGATDTDTGGSIDEACLMVDPSAQADFTVDVATWPIENEDQYRLEDVPCVVTSIAPDGDLLTTELACEAPDAFTHTITISISPPTEGTPAWGVDDEVMLEYDFWNDWELGTGEYRFLTLRNAAHDLLLAAVDRDDLPTAALAPFVLEVDPAACGEPDEPGIADVMQHAITFQLEGDGVTVIGGHRADLGPYSIQLETADYGHCCHFVTWYRLLIVGRE